MIPEPSHFLKTEISHELPVRLSPAGRLEELEELEYSVSGITDGDTVANSVVTEQHSVDDLVSDNTTTTVDHPTDRGKSGLLQVGEVAVKYLSNASEDESRENLAPVGADLAEEGKKPGDIGHLLTNFLSPKSPLAPEASAESKSPSKVAPPPNAAPASAGHQDARVDKVTKSRAKPDAAKAQQETKSGVREREDAELLVGSIVGKEWLVDKKIASGSFGTLFLGRHIQNNQLVAVKAERRDSAFPQLHREKKFYQMLTNGAGIPQILFYGECSTGHRYHILVMDLLGPNIEDLLQACGGVFSLKTTCMLACQLLNRIEFIHSKGILYRDIKSENFLIGRRKEVNHNVLHVVDFGLSKEYINPVSKQHVAFNVKKGSVGTPRYMSINALQHHEQGRRDDLEALSYLLLYLYLGQLPWQGLPGSTFAEKCRRILEKKLKMSVEEVCAEAPPEFARFMKYSRNLEYEAKPDYEFCRELFTTMLKRDGAEFDDHFDWDENIDDFWKERNKLLDNLAPLPDDISSRLRVAEEKDAAQTGRKQTKNSNSAVPFSRNGRLNRVPQQPTTPRSDAGCCGCYNSLKARFIGTSGHTDVD